MVAISLQNFDIPISSPEDSTRLDHLESEPQALVKERSSANATRYKTLTPSIRKQSIIRTWKLLTKYIK